MIFLIFIYLISLPPHPSPLPPFSPLFHIQGVRWSIDGVKAVTARNPRPIDNESLIIFVVGGMTCDELYQIKEVVERGRGRGGGKEVIVGSTCLGTGDRIMEGLLCL